ncbi:hypothetical protein [uncultured Salinisphaera sp.]|uniref:hypothetical protein n=1 Tax=uncultured Salinisphaera sp. TaxID=359372 RepID=UPI0032B29935|tara:strand:- start:1638 stop:1862 length:225 start_codon:yes stop_codon:yes gene_type:complete
MKTPRACAHREWPASATGYPTLPAFYDRALKRRARVMLASRFPGPMAREAGLFRRSMETPDSCQTPLDQAPAAA